MNGFVDPVAALVAREQQGISAALEQIDADITRAVGIPAALMEKDAQHQSKMRVWIDQARAIVLPTVTSFTFTQGDLDAIHEAHECAITDKATQARGWEIRKCLGSTRRNAVSWYEELRKPFRAVAEAIIGLQDRDVVPITEAEHVLGEKLIAYEKKAKAEEEEERKAKQAIADAEARAAQLRAAAAMQTVADAEPDPGVKAALTREATGIAKAPVAAASVTVASRRASVRGAGVTERHTGELLNKMEFVKAVVAGRIPLDAVDVRQSWIDDKARELKEQLGVVFPFLKHVKHDGTRG